MSKAGTLSIDKLKRALEYCPETGEFAWLSRPVQDFANPRAAAIYKSLCEGKHAFSYIGENGYRQTRILGFLVLAHRAAFALMTGEWPAHQVDHINGNRSDNRWCNLRLADQATNSRNMALSKRNTSGRIGISYDANRKRWVAQGRANKVQFNLGRFATMAEAIEARQRFERDHNFHPNHGRAA